MPRSYSENLYQPESRESLQREYASLKEQWERCWMADVRDTDRIKEIQEKMTRIYREIRNTEPRLSPEQRKILDDADLETLKKLYRECWKERVPYGDLVCALEREIYRKWIEKHKPIVKRIYKLDLSLKYEGK